MSRERRHWEELAETDPMWVILTEPGRKERWDVDAFFASGRQEVDAVLRSLTDNGIDPRRESALDFGCGIGRLTQALAVHFEHVDGVDISARMVESARSHNRFGERVRYHVNDTPALPQFASGTIDFVYSRITLQHIPRVAALAYIAEFGRILAPGGVACFQVLTRARSPLVRLRHRARDAMPELYRRLRDTIIPRARWELNVLDEASVRNALATQATRVALVIPDESAGPGFDSRIIVARRG